MENTIQELESHIQDLSSQILELEFKLSCERHNAGHDLCRAKAMANNQLDYIGILVSDIIDGIEIEEYGIALRRANTVMRVTTEKRHK